MVIKLNIYQYGRTWRINGKYDRKLGPAIYDYRRREMIWYEQDICMWSEKW